MTKPLPYLLSVVVSAIGCSQNVPLPDAGLPGAKAPPVEYRSPFDGYQAFADDKLVPWRDANEAVKEDAR